MAGVLQVEVVSARGRLWSGHASQVQVPLVDGSLGILPRRQPLLAEMGKGTVIVMTTDEGNHEVPVNGGVVSVDSDFVTIVTPEGSES